MPSTRRPSGAHPGATKHLNGSTSLAKPGLAKRAKNRVRRIQMEIPIFRQQAEELELQLSRLKLQQTLQLKSPLNYNNKKLETQNKTEASSVWNGIAERQFKERLRTEQEHKGLKDSCSELLVLSMELQKLLQKSQELTDWMETSGCVGGQLLCRFRDLSADADDKVFTEQLVTVARLHLELQQQQGQEQYQSLSRAMRYHCDLSMGREMVKQDLSVNAGIVFEMHCGITVPFNLDVVTEAYWRFLNCIVEDDYFLDESVDSLTDLIARSFALQADFEGFALQRSGKYTCRKYVDEDETTLVVVDNADVSFLGVSFNGLQYHKRGYIKLRRVGCQGAEQQSTSTVVETHFVTMPVFHESVVDTKQQIQALIDSVHRSYNPVNNIFCRILGGLLVQEDWKATFDSEALQR